MLRLQSSLNSSQLEIQHEQSVQESLGTDEVSKRIIELTNEAEQENKETIDFLCKYEKEEEKVHEIEEMLSTVAQNLHTLQYFKGKNIREFSNEKKEQMLGIIEDSHRSQNEIKKRMPIDIDQRRKTLRKLKAINFQKLKNKDRGVGGTMFH